MISVGLLKASEIALAKARRAHLDTTTSGVELTTHGARDVPARSTSARAAVLGKPDKLEALRAEDVPRSGGSIKIRPGETPTPSPDRMRTVIGTGQPGFEISVD